MKLRFAIDQNYDLQLCIEMLRGDDWEYRAKFMDLDYDLASQVHESSDKIPKSLHKELARIVDKKYSTLLPFMNRSKAFYEESWSQIIDEFSREVEKLTYPWIYDEYICIITHFNPGVSNWNGNIIGRWWKENGDMQRRITAHEILLAHYFSIHRKYFPKSGLSDHQIWMLAEIAAIALTGLEDRLKKFWPWDTSANYTNHNYPEIVILQKKLQQPFIQRKSFEEYILKGVELIRTST